MKRNISFIVLTFEIATIVILHAVKMSHATSPQSQDISANAITKAKISTVVVKQYPLLSIK